MSSGVVRIGDTVRRPAGPWTPAVHALLDHFHAVGFRGAPRALGIDEQGRWNLVVGEAQWAVIDWDTAAPGSRLFDLAYAMHGFVPLSANRDYQRGDPARRMRLLADEYGLAEAERELLVPMLARRAHAMHDFLAQQADVGVEPWRRLWQQGHGAAWQADADYTAEREDTWRRALLG